MRFSFPLLFLSRNSIALLIRPPSTLRCLHFPMRVSQGLSTIPSRSRTMMFSVLPTASSSSTSVHMEEKIDDDTTTTTTNTNTIMHIVDGISCREVPIDLPVVGIVTVLEATAESQSDLVDMALALDESEVYGEQKLAVGDPYGAVLWPSAWAVANYLLTTQTIDSDKDIKDRPLAGVSIVEVGTGTGLVSIAAALGGATVVATDYEPLALALTKYSAQMLHGERRLQIETRVLDMCDYDTPLPKADIVVAADIMYEPKTGAAIAHRAVEALKQGSRVIIGDSPGRPGRPAFLETLQSLGVSNEARFVDAVGRTCSGPRHDMICGEGSTSVSQTPKDLSVALMDLYPSMLK